MPITTVQPTPPQHHPSPPNRPSPATSFAALLGGQALRLAQSAEVEAVVAAPPSALPLARAEGGTQVTLGEIGSAAPPDKAAIPLGAIGANTPTVSHILTRDPRFKGQAWEIIFSAANRHKPYASLPVGSQIAIAPHTQELLITTPKAKARPVPPLAVPNPATPAPVATASPTAPLAAGTKEMAPPPSASQAPVNGAEQGENFGQRLVSAVKSYLGVPYSAVDCYNLVVRGLESLGVSYRGSDGLRQQLESKAVAEGRRANAHINGEGLIAAAGTTVYDESFSRVTNAAQQAEAVMRKLAPMLQEGMLLSFSTPKKGHTGVIAQRDGQWTYVNSGMIDHPIGGGHTSRRVGEEPLLDELKNWFALAKNRDTSLKVSAGAFDTGKLKLPAAAVASGHDRKTNEPLS